MSTTEVAEATEKILMFWLGALGVLGGERQTETLADAGRRCPEDRNLRVTRPGLLVAAQSFVIALQ